MNNTKAFQIVILLVVVFATALLFSDKKNKKVNPIKSVQEKTIIEQPKSEQKISKSKSEKEKSNKEQKSADLPPTDDLSYCQQYEQELMRREKQNYYLKMNAALSDDIGPWYLAEKLQAPTTPPKSHIDKFYRAFVYSGIIKISQIPSNQNLSLQYADEIISYDPTNLAGYLLKAFILHKAKKTIQAEEVLNLAELKATHYDTYTLKLKGKIFEITEGAADFMLAFRSENKLLASNEIIGVIIPYKKTKLAEIIMKPASDPTKLLLDLEWSSMDYQKAKSAMEVIKNKKYPDYTEVLKHKNTLLAKQFPEFDVNYESENQRHPQSEKTDCGWGNMEEKINLIKKALARSK